MMNERDMMLAMLRRMGASYDILDDGTIEIYGGGYDRSINIEFDAEGRAVEII